MKVKLVALAVTLLLDKAAALASPTWLNGAATALSKGQVVVVENFIDAATVTKLRNDATALAASPGAFKTSGLTNTAAARAQGGQQAFSELSDRSLCALDFASRFRGAPADGSSGGGSSGDGSSGDGHLGSSGGGGLGGDVAAREAVHAAVSRLQADLARALDRPTLAAAALAHEACYSIYQPGASLARHLDEHHEEAKGSGGWALPSRRSVSWLVYLNAPDWSARQGGSLRCFTVQPLHAVRAGEGSGGPPSAGAHAHNVQVGWLHDAAADEDAGTGSSGGGGWQPVFLDCWHQPGGGGGVAAPASQVPLSVAYVVATGPRGATRVAVGAPFDSASVAAVPLSGGGGGGGAVPLVARVEASLLSPALQAAWVAVEDKGAWAASGGDAPPEGTNALEVVPRGGTLVLFDSVTVPHEVTPVARTAGAKSRVALAGWFHEAQQPFPAWLAG